jgi:hypothetical protein
LRRSGAAAAFSAPRAARAAGGSDIGGGGAPAKNPERQPAYPKRETCPLDKSATLNG